MSKKYKLPPLTKLQVKLLLRLMNEADPDFNYRELVGLSIIMSDLEELDQNGKITWREKAKAKKQLK